MLPLLATTARLWTLLTLCYFLVYLKSGSDGDGFDRRSRRSRRTPGTYWVVLMLAGCERGGCGYKYVGRLWVEICWEVVVGDMLVGCQEERLWVEICWSCERGGCG